MRFEASERSRRTRFERVHGGKEDPGPGSPAERDRDRLIFSAEFRRLGGVTQVVARQSPSRFRSRLDHSLEVARIGSRIAQRLAGRQGARCEEGMDPQVVEAAALAHDLGHPPFGHVGEAELDAMLQAQGLAEGFEANAQTFRLLTRLCEWDPAHPGLDLTRATLNACLKYPRYRASRSTDPRWERSEKGIYAADAKAFEWARAPLARKELPVLEAQAVEWADDIGYAVQDFDDFFRAGWIRPDVLSAGSRERSAFLDRVLTKREETGVSACALEAGLDAVLCAVAGATPFCSTGTQRTHLAAATRGLTERFVAALEVEPLAGGGAALRMDPGSALQVAILKELCVQYVHAHSALSAQRYGYRRIVREVFEMLFDCLSAGVTSVIPRRYGERVEALREGDPVEGGLARLAADIVADMTDAELCAMHRRIGGADAGALHDRIVD